MYEPIIDPMFFYWMDILDKSSRKIIKVAQEVKSK